MSIFRSTMRAAADRAPFRSVIAAIVVAGLATIGVTAFAVPAAADDSAAVAVTSEVSDPEVAEPDIAATDGDAPPAAVRSVEAIAAPLLAPPGEEVVAKIEICHASASYKNPYIINEPAADGDVSGHAGHVGPIFFPEIPKHTEWGDIIPPFFYDDGGEMPAFFPGLNWDEDGQAIYENDCVIPTPTPTLVINPVGCVLYNGWGSLDFTIGPLQDNVDYLVDVWNSNGEIVATGAWGGFSGSIDRFFTLPPGDYSVTLSQSIIEDEWEILDEQFVTIGACPVLDVTATPGDCSTGDDGTATVLFTGLIEGESYDVSIDGPDSYLVSDTFTASGPTEELALDDLPPGDFVTSIEWDSDDEELTVSASFDFSVVACPAVPVTPAGLAVTGSEGVGAMLAGSMLLLGLGCAALLAARRREAGVRDVS